MTDVIPGLSVLASRYDVLFCDVWGVVHNGISAFKNATEALCRFREKGGKVVLLTNSPNPSRFVEAQLKRLGAPRPSYDSIVSSGDVTVSLLAERVDKGIFRIGPRGELALFEELKALYGKAVHLVPLKKAQSVLCIGLVDPVREVPEDYDALLKAMHVRRLELICANPDIVVEDGGVLLYCAGAIAERYSAIGGKVIHAGKPHALIYERAIALASAPAPINRSRVLVIGDAMRTDIKGACAQGFDSLFVTSGIHRNELHRGSGAAGLDKAAFRQFLGGADCMPTAAIPELVW